MDWVSFLAWTATISSIACQLVGIEICMRIVKKGGTGDITPVPFFAFFVSACLWLKYSIMRNIFSMMMANSMGAVLQFLYICLFYVYSVKKSHVHRLITISIVLLFAPLIYVRFIQGDDEVAADQLGLYGCMFTVLCYASPLTTLADVFKHKNCSTISFPLCLVNFIAAIEWFMFGKAISDQYVSLPNLLGIGLGVIQLGLFCIYPSRTSSKSSGSTVTL